MATDARKEAGAYYTPDETVAALIRWAVRDAGDRLLDPSCGDGRFLALHERSVGVEQDLKALTTAAARAPSSVIHVGSFFGWAAETRERFECAAGNPPFIRYQRFTGEVRKSALGLCRRLGVQFSSLSSSWAPFLVATASLLKPGGRMAFVVPAEIGHATYAVPLLNYLADNFDRVQLVAVREKIFADLSEDCWLLYADGFGGRTDHFQLTALDRFDYTADPPRDGRRVTRTDWARWNYRLRPFLMSSGVRSLYEDVAAQPETRRLGEVAKVGIGYVTGANGFFHLRPSAARLYRIPDEFLHPAVRNGRKLTTTAVTHATVKAWLRQDEPVLLLRIGRDRRRLPAAVREYLETPAGHEARKTYKCRMREPWYAVPDVHVPDGFLAYMSTNGPALVANHAGCVCTNSVHAVTLTDNLSIKKLQEKWADPFTALSCEVEGHPLGGGMLKVEPGEAARVLLPPGATRSDEERELIQDGIETMRRWRHCG